MIFIISHVSMEKVRVAKAGLVFCGDKRDKRDKRGRVVPTVSISPSPIFSISLTTRPDDSEHSNCSIPFQKDQSLAGADPACPSSIRVCWKRYIPPRDNCKTRLLEEIAATSTHTRKTMWIIPSTPESNSSPVSYKRNPPHVEQEVRLFWQLY